jgi:hypothetical protein
MSDAPAPAVADITFLERQVVAMQRRTAVRYRCAVGTVGRLSLPDNHDQREVWVYNLSETGIGLTMADGTLASGTSVTIRLRGPTPESAVALTARVVHATAQADGTWRIGCAFTARLTDEVVKALL